MSIKWVCACFMPGMQLAFILSRPSISTVGNMSSLSAESDSASSRSSDSTGRILPLSVERRGWDGEEWWKKNVVGLSRGELNGPIYGRRCLKFGTIVKRKVFNLNYAVHLTCFKCVKCQKWKDSLQGNVSVWSEVVRMIQESPKMRW